ncbi:DNA-binding protein [Subtercola sp. Z020]|uniref:helix-turn-helix domain-containing protein n=1 Tax=Subtercola sp. Z020 TaxID=2080582 RepID=UPI000CE77C84|nr:helix-turn-helix domain-containing protein [Subtercola sp. Z020]PPF77073.1 DNA-binding protein [Subtercola sp. Z020]
MTSTLTPNGTLLVDDSLRSEARGFVDAADDRTIVGLSAELSDGSTVELPADLTAFVGLMLSGLTRGPLSVTSIPAELTSTAAAELLAISRPTLMKWVKEGALNSHRVGSHHRFETREVMALAQARRAARADAFVALRALEDALHE